MDHRLLLNVHILLISTLLFATTVSGGPCQSIRVSNTIYQKSMEGVYTQSPSTCASGSTVWANNGQSIFIYYVSLAQYNAWIIGPGMCKDIASIFVTNYYYEYPYSSDLNGQWMEVDFMGNPTSNSALTVTCADASSSLSVGAIAGIMIASISALILILIIVVCCCSVHHHKRNRIRNVDPRCPANVVDSGSSDYHRYHDHLDPVYGYDQPPRYTSHPPAAGQWAMNVLPVQAPAYEEITRGPSSPPPSYHVQHPCSVQETTGILQDMQEEGIRQEETFERAPTSPSPMAVGVARSQSIGSCATPTNQTQNSSDSSDGLTPV